MRRVTTILLAADRHEQTIELPEYATIHSIELVDLGPSVTSFTPMTPTLVYETSSAETGGVTKWKIYRLLDGQDVPDGAQWISSRIMTGWGAKAAHFYAEPE